MIEPIVTSIVSFLAPYLPFLLNVGGKVLEGSYQQAGADGWDKAKAIWGKLQPKLEAKEAAREAAVDVAKNPEDKDSQASLRQQLKKILEADTALAEELAQILQEKKSDDKSGSSNFQAFDEANQQNIVSSVVNNPNNDFSRNINSPK